MSYPGYPGRSQHNRQPPPQQYQSTPSYQGYGQPGYQQPYQPPQGYGQPPPQQTGGYNYQQPPPSYGNPPPSYQPNQPYQYNQPPARGYPPAQPPQQQYQPPGGPHHHHQQQHHHHHQPPPQRSPAMTPTPAPAASSTQLKELTVPTVKQCKRFQDVVNAVREVATTNQLNYLDGPRAFNDLAVACWDTQMFGVYSTEYVSNTGESSRLLVLRGVLPIVFRGNQYQTPIEVFLPLQYPHRGPIPYVVPTATMRVVPNNPYVATDGLVRIDYLRDWKPSSSFAQMLTTMSSAFSQRPPLYAVAPGTPAETSATATPTHTATTTPSSSSTPQHQPPPGYGQPPSYEQSTPPHHASSTPSSSGTGSTHTNPSSSSSSSTSAGAGAGGDGFIPFQVPSSEADRRNMLQQIVEIKLVAAQSLQYKDMSKQITDLNDTKRELSNKQFTMAHALKSKADMLTELKRINQLLDTDISNAQQSITEQKELLEQINSVDEHGNKVFNFDKMIHFEGLSLQLVNEVAADRAYDDVLTQLDALLSGGQINIDTYLKEVRVQSRRQFMSRALATKINEAM